MRLKALGPDELAPPQRKVYEAIIDGPRDGIVDPVDGSLLGPFNAMLYNPEIGMTLQEMGAAIRYRGVLPGRARELAILTVAGTLESGHEWNAHAPIAESLGVPEELLSAIRRGEEPTVEGELDQTVLELARKQLRREQLSEAEYTHAVDTLGVDGLVELTTLVGYYGILAAQLALFGIL